MPGILAKHLPRPARAGLLRQYDDDEEVRFQVRVVPMGWSWAVRFIQAAHLSVLGSVLDGCPWLADKRPGQDLATIPAATVLYIDNFAIVSSDRSMAEEGI